MLGQPPQCQSKTVKQKLYALDATTVTLFSNIFAGTNKVQKITDAIRSDVSQMGSLVSTLNLGSMLLADRGYLDYVVQEAIVKKGLIYITRIKKNMRFATLKDLETPKKDKAVLFDKIISLKIDHLSKTVKTVLEELGVLELFKDLPP